MNIISTAKTNCMTERKQSKAEKIRGISNQLQQNEFRPHIINFSFDFYSCPLLQISGQLHYDLKFKRMQVKKSFSLHRLYMYVLITKITKKHEIYKSIYVQLVNANLLNRKYFYKYSIIIHVTYLRSIRKFKKNDKNCT